MKAYSILAFFSLILTGLIFVPNIHANVLEVMDDKMGNGTMMKDHMMDDKMMKDKMGNGTMMKDHMMDDKMMKDHMMDDKMMKDHMMDDKMMKDNLIKQKYSPRKQLKMGIDIHEIQCKTGHELVLKASNWSPACVKHSSVDRLVKIGWASNHIPSKDELMMKDSMMDDKMKDSMMDDKMKDSMMDDKMKDSMMDDKMMNE